MPFGMSGYPQVVLFEGKVYIGGGDASSDRAMHTVMVYDPQQDSFDTLPPYTCKCFSMAIVNNQLVLVGGYDVHITGKVTNKLGVWNEESRKWTHPLPSMTTACYSPSVTSHNNRWLVVMAGVGDKTYLSRIEILHTTESGQWYHAAPLPRPCYGVSTVTIGNMCYLVGGISGGRASKKVFCVNLDDLISQALSQHRGAPPTPSPWMTLTDTPESWSTAFSLNGSLLSVGGGHGGSKAIYHYQPSSKSWIKAREVPARRSRCACTILPSGEVFVAGGGCNDKLVDIASSSTI